MRAFILLLVLAFFISIPAKSQETEKRKNWLCPDFYNMQYAGSIGLGSVGIGYNFAKEKAAVSVHYGYLPTRFGGELHTATLKYIYRPWNIGNKKLNWTIANPGLFVSNTFGKGFQFTWPDEKYPKGYYWWSPSLRVHPSISTELEFMLKGNVKAISVYAEANTNDLYIFSYFANPEWLSPYKIFKAGYGINLKF